MIVCSLICVFLMRWVLFLSSQIKKKCNQARTIIVSYSLKDVCRVVLRSLLCYVADSHVSSTSAMPAVGNLAQSSEAPGISASSSSSTLYRTDEKEKVRPAIAE